MIYKEVSTRTYALQPSKKAILDIKSTPQNFIAINMITPINVSLNIARMLLIEIGLNTRSDY